MLCRGNDMWDSSVRSPRTSWLLSSLLILVKVKRTKSPLQPQGTGKPTRREEPSQYPALIAKLMVRTNLDIRPSCHLLSEPKESQRKSLLKESWRTINHCSNSKLGEWFDHWNWRKTTGRDGILYSSWIYLYNSKCQTSLERSIFKD